MNAKPMGIGDKVKSRLYRCKRYRLKQRKKDTWD